MSDETHVYIICRIKSNKPKSPVKVGISSNPAKRIASLQTANPFQLVLLTTFYCPTLEMARSLEASFHETQSDRRLWGEWFNIHPMELREIAIEHSGVRLNEEKLSAWKAYAARHLNQNEAQP